MTNRDRDTSLVDTFHRVGSLVPSDQQLATIRREATVGEALRIMKESNFSQLPVVAGDEILGVFSYRSFSQKAAEQQSRQRNLVLADQPVIDFMEDLPVVFPTMDWAKVQRHLDEKDGFFVTDGNGLPGLVTTMDVFEYFREIANPFILVAEIEVALRRLISDRIPVEDHRAIFERNLSGAYSGGKVPSQLGDLSLANYVTIVTGRETWHYFEEVLGSGDTARKTAAKRLLGLHDLRNDAFHFKRPLKPYEIKRLSDCREWLQISIRAYESERKHEAVPADFPRSNPNYQRLAANFTPADESFFSWLLTEVHHRAENYAIRWNPASFSIQQRRLEQRPVSIAYGWQDQFDVYFGYLDLSAEELAHWRKALLAFGVFTESGKHTLKAKLSEVDTAKLQDACRLMLDEMATAE